MGSPIQPIHPDKVDESSPSNSIELWVALTLAGCRIEFSSFFLLLPMCFVPKTVINHVTPPLAHSPPSAYNLLQLERFLLCARE